MEEKYRNYIESFNKLDIYDKRSEITNELLELIRVFHKINMDFNINDQILPVLRNGDTEEEYLTRLFTYILSLKEVSAGTMKLILEKMYEKM